MADLIADIKLRWRDDSALLEDDPRQILESFLDSIGVTSDVARDILEAMVMARAKDVPLTTKEVKLAIHEIRVRRKVEDISYGLTDRNIQVWLRYFESIGLFESNGKLHRFSNNKTPSKAFEKTKEVVQQSIGFSDKLLKKLEKAYEIR